MHALVIASHPSVTVDPSLALAALLAGKAIASPYATARYAPMPGFPQARFRVMPVDARPAFHVQTANQAIAELGAL